MTGEVTPLFRRAPQAPADVPSKCKDAYAAGSPANPCTEPGAMLRCMLCPDSPTYWRRENG